VLTVRTRRSGYWGRVFDQGGEKDGPGQNAFLEWELRGIAKITSTDGGLVEKIGCLVEKTPRVVE
jgi:hypothetical protein